MEKILMDIVESFESDSGKYNDVLQGKHIFSSLEKHFAEEIEEKRTFLYYYMTTSDRALVHYRNREMAQGDYCFSRAESMINDFPDEVKYGMNNLHLAISSYRNYVNNNFEDAESQLNCAIDFAILQSQSFPGFISVIGEQWLNKIRIYIKKKDVSRIYSNSIELLQLILYGIHSNSEIENSYKATDMDDRLGMLNHVINSILAAYENSFKEVDSFFKNVCDKINLLDRTSVNNDVLKGFLLFKFSAIESDQYVEDIHSNRILLSELPRAMQRKIFKNIFLDPERNERNGFENNERIKLLKRKYFN